jgi:hypothetical protein
MDASYRGTRGMGSGFFRAPSLADSGLSFDFLYGRLLNCVNLPITPLWQGRNTNQRLKYREHAVSSRHPAKAPNINLRNVTCYSARLCRKPTRPRIVMKSETNSNDQITEPSSIFWRTEIEMFVSLGVGVIRFWILVICHCFGFRISSFEPKT